VVVLGVLAALLQPAPAPLRRDGRCTTVDVGQDGRDFADAVARAMREAERDGASVTRVERLGPV